jgi:hypothetical protein
MFSDAVRLPVDFMDQQSTIVNNWSLVWGGYLAVIDRRRKNMHIFYNKSLSTSKKSLLPRPLYCFNEVSVGASVCTILRLQGGKRKVGSGIKFLAAP